MIPLYLYFIYEWMVKCNLSIKQVEARMKIFGIPPATYIFDKEMLEALELLKRYNND